MNPTALIKEFEKLKRQMDSLDLAEKEGECSPDEAEKMAGKALSSVEGLEGMDEESILEDEDKVELAEGEEPEMDEIQESLVEFMKKKKEAPKAGVMIAKMSARPMKKGMA